MANEIANLFSKPKKKPSIKTTPDVATVNNSNPRKTSGNRRMSKTFRRTPTIIIHPPEDTSDRFTNSCPDIQALLTQENCTPIITNDLNYSCPDINAIPSDITRSPSPNLSKFNTNFSRSCPNINTLHDNKIKQNDLTNSCPNIDKMGYKRTVSLDSNDDESFEYRFDYPKSYDSFGNPFEKCLHELDILKNEVNEIKNECECILYECKCQRQYQQPEFKMVHYNTPVTKNPFKILPTRHSDLNLKTGVRFNRKISFSNIPYTHRLHDLLTPSYTRTASEPNLLKNFRPFNRSCSDVGQTRNDSEENIRLRYENTGLRNENSGLRYENQGLRYDAGFHYESTDSLNRPSSLNVIKSNESLDTFPKQKVIKKSPRKHDISPTDILRNKMKQSLSMFDLNSHKPDDTYDYYHTIHGGMKFPKDLTEFSLKNYKQKSEVEVLNLSGQNLFENNEHLVALVKCCCGLTNCQNGRLQVVPITFQQLLESNRSHDTVR